MIADAEARNVRWITLGLISLATILLELAVAEPGRAPWLCVLTALGLLVIPAWALAWLLDRRGRSASRSRIRGPQATSRHPDQPQATTVFFLFVLFALPFLNQLAHILLSGRGLMLELVLLAALRNLGLGLGVLAFRPVMARLGAVISLFLVLGAASLGEGHWILMLLGLYAITATLWLMLIHWNGIAASTEMERVKPLPWSAAVWGLVIVTLCGLAVVGPTRTATALAGLVPTSGGTDWSDREARGGVNDGDHEVSASENPQSVGFTQSEVYLDSDRPSLYDTFNDMYGEPFKVKKTERMIALQSETIKEQKELPVENLQAGREFPIVRRKPETPMRRPGQRAAKALLYLKGQTPLHLRMAIYDRFDGLVWHEQAANETSSSIEKEGQSDWLRLVEAIPSIFRGTQTHSIKVGLLDSEVVPAPAQLARFRLGSVDQPDFFGWVQGGLLRMIQRTVPAGTVIETESQLVDQNQLAQLAFPPNAVPTTRFLASTDNFMIQSEVAELARIWTLGLGRGWRQVQRVVDRLRTDYRLERTTAISDTSRDPITTFLLQTRRGADYHFATAAVVLLRSLGYRARLVSGFYASPERYDVRTRHTSVLQDDVHFWAEVLVAPECWVTIEPSPGYSILDPPPTLAERAARGLAFILQWAHKHITTLGCIVVLVTGSLGFRHVLLDRLATLTWWLRSASGASRCVQATLFLVESRSKWAGHPRPPGQTPARWYGLMLDGMAFASRADLQRLVRVADWMLHDPGAGRGVSNGLEQDVRAVCRRVIRDWTVGRIRTSALAPLRSER